MKRFILSIGLVLVASQALALCSWQYDCTGGYPCKQVPICSSTLGIVPPKPPAIAPIPSPSIRPIPTPTIPPIGTSSCTLSYTCQGLFCSWKNICE